MEITPEFRELCIETAEALKGSDRCQFMARVVKVLGKGGQRKAEKEFGWNRRTIRRGMHEVESGFEWVDNFSARGRKKIEEHLPQLLEDIQKIIDSVSHATNLTSHPTNLTTPSTDLTAKEVRNRLIQDHGYTDSELPSDETIRMRLRQLGHRPSGNPSKTE